MTAQDERGEEKRRMLDQYSRYVALLDARANVVKQTLGQDGTGLPSSKVKVHADAWEETLDEI